jgi:hypothetical protein
MTGGDDEIRSTFRPGDALGAVVGPLPCAQGGLVLKKGAPRHRGAGRGAGRLAGVASDHRRRSPNPAMSARTIAAARHRRRSWPGRGGQRSIRAFTGRANLFADSRGRARGRPRRRRPASTDVDEADHPRDAARASPPSNAGEMVATVKIIPYAAPGGRPSRRPVRRLARRWSASRPIVRRRVAADLDAAAGARRQGRRQDTCAVTTGAPRSRPAPRSPSSGASPTRPTR